VCQEGGAGVTRGHSGGFGTEGEIMRMRSAIGVLAVATLSVGTSAGAAETPVAALERMKAGNGRFVENAESPLPGDGETRLALTKGQSPYSIVLTCADSRVPPEIIFNAGLGELFVVRTAGEVTDKAVLASVEYAAEHLRSSLLVVMGHESCGAVEAASARKPGAPSMGPNLDYLVKRIQPAFDRMRTPADAQHIREATLANVEQVVNDILENSAVIKHLQGKGELMVIGAYYELSTGRVRFSEPVKVDAGHGAGTAAAPHE
jgi:carbonic anhydrase